MTSISSFKPLRDTVFVTNLDSGNHITKGGIILRDDNMTEAGIHPRWAQVFAVGPDVTDLGVGEWVYVKHGRWTNSMTLGEGNEKVKIWRVEYPEAVLVACDEDPRETAFV